MTIERIQVRRGPAANWTAVNPILAAGEWGFETDTNKLKIGNANSNVAWNALPYIVGNATLALANVTPSANAFPYFTGPAAATTVNGTNLLSLANLSGAASQIPYFTGAGTMGLANFFAGKNVIINGDMKIAQRGTSFVGLTTASFCLDRWRFYWNHTGAQTITQDSDVPTGKGFANSLKLNVTTADANMANGKYVAYQTRIEGSDIYPIASSNVTLSWWVKSPKTGTHCVWLQNSGATYSYNHEYTVIAANTWEQKSMTLSLSGMGAITPDNTLGLRVSFLVAGKTNPSSNPDTWENADKWGTANQVNCIDANGSNFYLTGIQLESGSAATPFGFFPYQQEFALCQRYYQQYLDHLIFMVGFGESNSLGLIQTFFYPVPMRVAPTLTVLDGNDGATGTTLTLSAGIGHFYATVNPIGSSQTIFYQWHMTANSEL